MGGFLSLPSSCSIPLAASVALRWTVRRGVRIIGLPARLTKAIAALLCLPRALMGRVGMAQDPPCPCSNTARGQPGNRAAAVRLNRATVTLLCLARIFVSGSGNIEVAESVASGTAGSRLPRARAAAAPVFVTRATPRPLVCPFRPPSAGEGIVPRPKRLSGCRIGLLGNGLNSGRRTPRMRCAWWNRCRATASLGRELCRRCGRSRSSPKDAAWWSGSCSTRTRVWLSRRHTVCRAMCWRPLVPNGPSLLSSRLSRC
mmetsp:Transcript_139297/g.347251  ORF Transcript_139297/g.347251 Transcript_139297/m.347251 type:complete len:258 (-) Transcript_139297:295-1068(-)